MDSKHPMDNDLLSVLQAEGLERHAEILAKEEITLESLRTLTVTDLTDLGFALGPRKQLLALIARLNGAEAPPASPAGPGADMAHAANLVRSLSRVTEAMTAGPASAAAGTPAPEAAPVPPTPQALHVVQSPLAAAASAAPHVGGPTADAAATAAALATQLAMEREREERRERADRLEREERREREERLERQQRLDAKEREERRLHEAQAERQSQLAMSSGLLAAGVAMSGGGRAGGPSTPVTLHFEDGSEYVGGAVDGKPSGRGTLTYSSSTPTGVPPCKDDGETPLLGGTYMGEFKAGKRHGEGVMKFRTGQLVSRYEGMWEFDVPEGVGKFEYTQGNKVVEGTFKDGKLSGPGRIVSMVLDSPTGEAPRQMASQMWTTGTWSAGQMHGTMVFDFLLSRRKVTLFFEEGVTDTNKHPATLLYGPMDPQRRVRYEGALRKGSFDVREGQGKLTWTTNHTYTGTFVNDELTGHGEKLYPPSEEVLSAKGEFVKGVLHGPGERRFRPVNGSSKPRKPEIGEFVQGSLVKRGCMGRMCGK